MFVEDRGNLLDDMSHKYSTSAMTYMPIKCTGRRYTCDLHTIYQYLIFF